MFAWRRVGVDVGVGSDRLQYHNEHVLKKYGAKLKVGTVKEEAKL